MFETAPKHVLKLLVFLFWIGVLWSMHLSFLSFILNRVPYFHLATMEEAKDGLPSKVYFNSENISLKQGY